jgi:hypothetical protein
MPSVSTDFSRNVQEDSQISEFPKGITAKAFALRKRYKEKRYKEMSKVVAVIGASSNRSKFGNRAVRAFRQQGS